LSSGLAAFVTVLLLATAAGCGDDAGDSGTATSPKASTRAPEKKREEGRVEAVAPSNCSPGLASCSAAEGRIVYVERVDPDGDGDAHFVIADPQGITLRGLTAIDVRKGLRPHPLPGPGDLISAAGPVQTGSYGQSQIHAIELHVAGR
jgi:hypothetical protein